MTDPKLPLPALWEDARALSRYPVHEARESAIRILTDAYAYDAITEVEFERRLGRLSAADSAPAIGAIVEDLPVMGTAEGRSSRRMLPTPRSKIAGFMSEIRRNGPWVVPEHLSIRAVMCDMKIDLRYAVIQAPCTIDVTAVMASVSLLVLPGLTVEFDMQPFLAAVGSDADGGALGGHLEPHVRVVGTAVMSEVRVRLRRA
ncbi:hypothetical protein BH11GEM1_BH11GEM1_01360 [soil metagenome]